MKETSVIVIILIIIAIFCLIKKANCKGNEDFTTGYAVTSGLAYNNRLAYCQPGQEEWGGSWSGGCTIPHRVIV